MATWSPVFEIGSDSADPACTCHSLGNSAMAPSTAQCWKLQRLQPAQPEEPSPLLQSIRRRPCSLPLHVDQKILFDSYFHIVHKCQFITGKIICTGISVLCCERRGLLGNWSKEMRGDDFGGLRPYLLGDKHHSLQQQQNSYRWQGQGLLPTVNIP